MKLPRLQYTYFISYQRVNHLNKWVSGNTDVVTEKMISNLEDIRSAENKLPHINIILTNYKLLSVKVVWS